MDTEEYTFYLNEIGAKIKSLTDNLWDIQVNGDYFKAKHKLEEQVIYDILNGYEGEKYDLAIAKNIYNKYKNSIDTKYTCDDVYVAINAQYHDYSTLFHK